MIPVLLWNKLHALDPGPDMQIVGENITLTSHADNS